MDDIGLDDLDLVLDVNRLLKVATATYYFSLERDGYLSIKGLNYLLKKSRYFIKNYYAYYGSTSYWWEVEEKFHLEKTSLWHEKEDCSLWEYVRWGLEDNRPLA